MINSWFNSIYISFISPKINHSWLLGHKFCIKAVAFDISWQVFCWASSLRKRRSFHWPLVIFETSWRATMCHDVKDETKRLRGIWLACQTWAIARKWPRPWHAKIVHFCVSETRVPGYPQNPVCFYMFSSPVSLLWPCLKKLTAGSHCVFLQDGQAVVGIYLAHTGSSWVVDHQGCPSDGNPTAS